MINLNLIINKIKEEYKHVLYIIISLVLLGIVFSIGVYAGVSRRPEIEKVTNIVNKTPTVETTADFNAFWKAWNILKDKSIYTDKITDQERVWGAIKGLASSTDDPYTTFFDPTDNKMFKDEIKGSFGGIGAEIGMKDKVLTVIAPLKGTPAWKAGIQKGDKILKINKISTANMTIDQAINNIRGEKGTSVALNIYRSGENETRDISIIRDTIEIPTIETEARPDGIFVIKFYSFSENSDTLFANALQEFIKTGDSKLILDLRGNPGGYLEVAVNIASWFIDEGKVIVSEDFGANRKPQLYRSHGPKVFTDKLNFIVLVDGGSASAAEILAGALEEHNIATLVGDKTYGKGSVQELIDITPETSLKITIAKWFTPDGVSISEAGLEPNIKVPMTYKDVEAKKDPQMDKAVEILKAKQ